MQPKAEGEAQEMTDRIVMYATYFTYGGRQGVDLRSNYARVKTADAMLQ